VRALLPLLLAASAAAADLEDARANFDTVVRNHVAQRADASDVWTLKRKGGAPMKLKLARIEAQTVHPAAGGRWRGLADFTSADGKKSYVAEVVVATGSDLWDVKSLRWLGKEETYDLRSAFIKSARTAGRRKAGPKGSLPELSLSDAAGQETFLPECPKAKCLTVYLTPWCPYCRRATGLVQALQKELPEKGVPVRVVVGQDEDVRCRDYAAQFGTGTLLDCEKRWQPKGVPHFFVSDGDGGVLAAEAGAPEGVSAAQVAASLGL
jgi:thiol-disulfide isomerase/thioredoxin